MVFVHQQSMACSTKMYCLVLNFLLLFCNFSTTLSRSFTGSSSSYLLGRKNLSRSDIMAPNIFNKLPSLWRTPKMIIARAFQTMRHSKPPGNNNECEPQSVFEPTSDIELENEESEPGRNGLNSLLPGLHSNPTSSLLQSAISPWTTQPAMLPYEYDPRAAIQDSSFNNIGGDMHSSTVNDHSHHERVEHNYHTNIIYHLHFGGSWS
ncbi:hypothetical protein DFJ43DRAFT_648438 [Lentinula guzmanii]|uniref:Uncharacterized protein n=1 Tax=Lentinula guzmanii TaxID=2804957 RepID=A0AA38JED4_9AGAR|nr:hypothetical protein DFJ43DRAFT_648438 [Lentinula guzmanii]